VLLEIQALLAMNTSSTWRATITGSLERGMGLKEQQPGIGDNLQRRGGQWSSAAQIRPGKLLAGGWPANCRRLGKIQKTRLRVKNGAAWAGRQRGKPQPPDRAGDLVFRDHFLHEQIVAYSNTSAFSSQLLGMRNGKRPCATPSSPPAFCGWRIRVKRGRWSEQGAQTRHGIEARLGAGIRIG